MTRAISADFPFESKYLDVLGSKIHYIEQGKGDPILFLHDVPLSNYLWRNIIPALSRHGRCIAPDLIGMGKSGKPDIGYRIFDHIRYINDFIKQLGLSKITFVLHGWSSLIGFNYLAQYASKVKGLVLIEAYLQVPTSWDMVALPVQELVTQLMGSSDSGFRAVIAENFLLEKALPAMVLRKLTHEEMAFYRAPFPTPESRKPLWQYIQDLPLPDGPQDVKDLINHNLQYLQQSRLPKLMIYGMPGFITPVASIEWARSSIPHLQLSEIGDVLHCPQETQPEQVSEALIKWFEGFLIKK